jgi:hypothetical protein
MGSLDDLGHGNIVCVGKSASDDNDEEGVKEREEEAADS